MSLGRAVSTVHCKVPKLGRPPTLVKVYATVTRGEDEGCSLE